MGNRIGKTIHIDLSSELITTINTDEKLIQEYFGGRGLGVKILSELTGPDIDPLSPANPLIFTSGPLSGFVPMASGAVLTSKSPLTGTVFSWNISGSFGRELKRAEIDALIITGKAKRPSYIEVKGDNFNILPAEEFWGKNTEHCTEVLKSKGSVACIGRAGEKKVLISSLIVDSIYSGRGGLGAVAGSKLLKAIVVKGEKNLLPVDTLNLDEGKKKILKLQDSSPMLSKGLGNYGTAALVKLLDYMNLIPSNNFSRTGTSFADLLSGEYIKASFELGKESCPGCPLGCKKRITSSGISPGTSSRIDKGQLIGHVIPDYDSLWAFGFNLENPDFTSIVQSDAICRDYGLDPISAGSVLAAYSELRAKTIGKDELEELLLKIGEGLELEGAYPGAGARKYLSDLGKREFSMDVKGLELGGFDPRGVKGQALAYATSNRGGDYLTAFMVGPEVLGKPVNLDRHSIKGKAGILQVFENLTAMLDSLVFCPFSIFIINEEICASLLSAVAGMQIQPAKLFKIGERIWNLERIYNLKTGFTWKDDTLPGRVFKNEKIGEINRTEHVEFKEKGKEYELSKEEFENAVREYYHYRDLNEKGEPTLEKLKELGLNYKIYGP